MGRYPIHKGSNPNQFHASRTKNIFHCFGNCHAGGNVLAFVAMMEGGDKDNEDDVRAAAVKLQGWFGLTFERPAGGRKRPSASAPAAATASVSTSEPAEGPSVSVEQPQPGTTNGKGSVPLDQAQSIEGEPTAEVPQTAEGGSAPEPAGVNPPLKFALKSLDPEHPYLKDRGFSPETIATFKELAKEKGLIMIEGFFDAMRVHEAGFPQVVALMGSSLSDAQERLIVESVGPGGRVALMFDEDDAGWKGIEDALSRLSGRVYVRIIGLGQEGTQPDRLSPEALARCVGNL